MVQKITTANYHEGLRQNLRCSLNIIYNYYNGDIWRNLRSLTRDFATFFRADVIGAVVRELHFDLFKIIVTKEN